MFSLYIFPFELQRSKERANNMDHRDHSSSPQRPSKRRGSSDVQEEDKASRNRKSSVSYRPSFSGFSNENGSSNKRRRKDLSSRFELPNDMKEHHKSYRTSNNYHRKISYENKASECAEEEEERHFKRRPSWSSSMRPEIAIAWMIPLGEAWIVYKCVWEREYKCSGYSVLISLIKKLTGVLIFTYLLNFVSILLLHW